MHLQTTSAPAFCRSIEREPCVFFLIFRGRTELADAVWLSGLPVIGISNTLVFDISSAKSQKSAAVIRERSAQHQDMIKHLVGIIKMLIMQMKLYHNFVDLAGVS
ncbi:uncharacterized protein LOC110607148 [Manihot esculenta]|uniref:uncharacterized protein LOC110607148 n=1 Tax=Manihot esculenta TaxID=3983 RepID=UPI001CC3FF75|nr:uncharacterized protein LOC110607148 [Manihot esculenta]